MFLIGFPQFIATAREVDYASNKLVILVGASGSGKTALIKKAASELSWPVVNIGRDLSERLLALTLRQRRLKAEEIVSDLLDATGGHRLCLDNTEVLFDPFLALNPLNLLLNLSRNRVLITSWNGRLENGSLVYGYPGHPEYVSVPASGFPVVTVADDKLHLFLRP